MQKPMKRAEMHTIEGLITPKAGFPIRDPEAPKLQQPARRRLLFRPITNRVLERDRVGHRRTKM